MLLLSIHALSRYYLHPQWLGCIAHSHTYSRVITSVHKHYIKKIKYIIFISYETKDQFSDNSCYGFYKLVNDGKLIIVKIGGFVHLATRLKLKKLRKIEALM